MRDTPINTPPAQPKPLDEDTLKRAEYHIEELREQYGSRFDDPWFDERFER
jgi:hypothetical protein